MHFDFAKPLKVAALALGLGLGALGAHAATVNCPGTPETTDREFSLTTTVATTCITSGVGNINGNPAQDPLLAFLGAGYSMIDKSDLAGSGITLTGLGTTSGTFSIDFANLLTPPPAGSIWTNLVLALKSGEGQFNPDWAAFGLPDGVTSGSWTISSQGLSHMNIYGQLSAVPLPAGLPLLLGSFALMGLVMRRKSGKSV